VSTKVASTTGAGVAALMGSKAGAGFGAGTARFSRSTLLVSSVACPSEKLLSLGRSHRRTFTRRVRTTWVIPAASTVDGRFPRASSSVVFPEHAT